MTEEIKEILNRFNFVKNEPNKLSYYPEDLLNRYEMWLLYDYITNLQQELQKANDTLDTHNELIEKLQQDLDKANDIIEKDRQFYKCRMDEYVELKKENQALKELNICVGCENNPNYKLRCLKAIEEINYWGIDKEHNDNSAMRLALGNILNILIGSDAK